MQIFQNHLQTQVLYYFWDMIFLKIQILPACLNPFRRIQKTMMQFSGLPYQDLLELTSGFFKLNIGSVVKSYCQGAVFVPFYRIFYYKQLDTILCYHEPINIIFFFIA